jgi:hypothetical protein
VSLYPVASRAAVSFTEDGEVPGGGLTVAFRLADVVSPLRNGRQLGAGDRSALVIGGTERIRAGEVAVSYCQILWIAGIGRIVG